MANTPKDKANSTTASAPEKSPADINRRVWDLVYKTDPSATKKITGKRFGGTSVKPMWITKRVTEAFGPAGIGWGMSEPKFEFIHGQDGQVLVFSTVTVWYIDPETKERGSATGVGGELVVKSERNGMFFDDEACKKAYTDALGNAWKFVGVAGDIHMGQHDDDKYVQEINAEFRAEEDKLGKQADELEQKIKDCDDLKVLTTEILPDVKTLIGELGTARRQAEAGKLTTVYNARKAKLTPPAETVDDPTGQGGTTSA